MEQDEQEDPALTAKKAALLALLDAPSRVNGHGDSQKAYINPSNSEGNNDKSETSVQNCTLQSVEHMEQENGIPSTVCSSSPKADCHKNSEFTSVNSESPNIAVRAKVDSHKKEFQSSEDNFTKGCKSPETGLIVMEQDEQEDPALTAKKAALLALLDAPSRVNGQGDSQEAYINPSVSEGNDKSETSMQNCTLQSVEQMEQENGIPSTMCALSSKADCHKNSEFTSVNSESPNIALRVKVDSHKNSEFTCVDSETPNNQQEIFAPLLALNFEKEFQSSEDNFTKGCKWSPDGSCLLVGSNDKVLRIFNLPSRVACGDIQDESWFFEESSKHINPALTMKEGECIYDYTWYPAMHSSDAQSCCFAVTCRGCPVHLWDAWHGKLICSYLPYDHLDELVAAYSIAFNLDGSELFCGFNKAIRIFQVSRPGREFVKIDAKDQPGIISCMAFNPALPSVFVAGSYLGNLGLYSTDRNALFCRIDGCPKGMTQIKFSSDGIKLFSGARMNNKILCWDLRNPGKLLWSFRREVNTNQRISFDLEPHSNNFLISGTTNGSVLKWSLQDLPVSDGDDPEMIKTYSKFVAHKDCCNGVSLNPHFPVLATSSGQRHFPEPQSFSSSDSCSEDDGPLFLYRKNKYENSVKLWWLG